MDKVKKNSGFILATALVIMAILLLLATSLLDFFHSEEKLVNSQSLATKAYYLAEAGAQEALWKLRTDADWQTNFQTNPTWQTSLTRTNVLASSSSYLVTIKNQDLSQAEMISTGTISFAGLNSQRVIKTKIFQALAPINATPTTVFVDKNFSISNANLTAQDGEIFVNQNIQMGSFSNITTNLGTKANQNININWSSSITGSKYAKNYPPRPSAQSFPQIDFDSTDPQSLKNRATTIYTTTQFNTAVNNSNTLTLNGITYVRGDVNLPRGKTLIINGALVADGNISFGTELWPIWLSGPSLQINHTISQPSGLFSKKNITFGSYINSLTFNGVAYALNSITLNNNISSWHFTGSFFCQQLDFSSLWQNVTITYNADIINSVFSAGGNAPIITVEHWEEEY